MADYPSLSPLKTGLACRCPRCGKGDLFSTFLRLLPACGVCGLNYDQADTGDGPAVFIIFISGFIGVSLAFIARFVWFMSIFQAFILAAGVAIASVLMIIRPLKATMLAAQFATKAEEGRLR